MTRSKSVDRGVLAGLILLSAVAAAASLGWGRSVAQEADIPALLRQKGCHACHSMSDPLLGPAYQAIAVMHGSADAETVDALAQKIRLGGAGAWGVVPMPRNDRVSEEEARTIAAWILAQTPE